MRAGPEKAVRPYYKSIQPRVLKLQENLFPNWSYDKILIDLKLGWAGWENIWLSVVAHGLYAMTSSQIFSHPALPLSKYITFLNS